jgi:phosphatidylserine decarboxylase
VFAPEGYPIIGASVGVGTLLAGTGWWWGGAAGALAVVLGFAAVAFTLYFFRDPDRTPPPGAEELLLAPADGKVVEIVENEDEPLYLGGEATRVSIFLSPLNVHVNRVPVKGQIEYENYVPGEYLVAWHPKASKKNERSELGMHHDPSGTKVLFKQIAGAVARRIVYHLREGDRAKAGERFGLVRFGSRMDVIVPPSVEVTAEEGDRVRGGESVLGELPDAPASSREKTSLEDRTSPEDRASAESQPASPAAAS